MTKSQTQLDTSQSSTDLLSNSFNTNSLEYYKKLFKNKKIIELKGILTNLLKKNTILHKAVEENEIDFVKEVLKIAPQLTELKILENGYTLLHTALNCIPASIEMIETLLKVDPMIIHEQDKQELTPVKFWEQYGSDKELSNEKNNQISSILANYEYTTPTLDELINDLVGNDIELMGMVNSIKNSKPNSNFCQVDEI